MTGYGGADLFLWGILPYVVLVIVVGGLVWRFRYDRFGWTTRSSELYESRLLRIGSPLFHFGLLVVIVGHVVGLLVPESWTRALGVSDTLYHVTALSLGLVAGVCTLAGVALLVWRRRTTGPVFSATTANDKVMYLVLVLAILTGLGMTVYFAGVEVAGGHSQDYRETVSPWFRSIWILSPDIAAMAAAELPYRVHALMGLALFALLPFTRLVHMFSAPVGYLFRPYVLYRTRDVHTGGAGQAERAGRRGW
ncbi:respiratory nitrate reductase subunit gamma [Nocardiopsis changdeensis]|uniref:Respiratory nitrate reductase subunit gamma n=1 Tax=Nocardiopsis changdeensis TaxID=2831969 RepID=A0ABX8BLG2_9ACTN|nr:MULTISPECIES: respiratory nitrate reductase subunit gamma [Nocardiopsis]QUX22383.1 respiratory nitrate reductase subunit gamma [Nocardiopsis changdeensis]QYX38325.1 respiratory nitrate reductase subunit gamma [Nocardiopsis sp. MT53]